ncbi:MAG: hypothetical protein WCC94_08350, partial [Candidatus Bathyarchaeia archaeon]
HTHKFKLRQPTVQIPMPAPNDPTTKNPSYHGSNSSVRTKRYTHKSKLVSLFECSGFLPRDVFRKLMNPIRISDQDFIVRLEKSLIIGVEVFHFRSLAGF